MPDTGGEPELIEITGLPDAASTSRMAVVPGSSIGFLDLAMGTEDRGIAAFDLSTGVALVVMDEGQNPRWAASGHLLWTRGGIVFAAPFDLATRSLTGRSVPVLQGVAGGFTGEAQYTVSSDGTLLWVPGAQSLDRGGFELAWVENDTLNRVDTAPSAFNNPRLSPDGERVAVEISESTPSGPVNDLWIIDLAVGTRTRFTDGGGQDAVWSPNGEWVYYEGRPRGDRDIWRRRADFSTAAEPVLEADGEQTPTGISPDGQRLFYDQWVRRPDGTRYRIWSIDLDTRDTSPMLDSSSEERWASVSPDGRLVAYASAESGAFQTYRTRNRRRSALDRFARDSVPSVLES